VRNSFRGSFFLVVVLLVAFSATGFSAACVAGNAVTLAATLMSGTPLPSAGLTCTEGIYTFSNFVVTGDAVPAPVSNFQVVLGPSTNASTLALGFAYTDLDSNGDDFTLTFQISPGVSFATVGAGPVVSVTELLCSVPTTGAGSCPGTRLNTSPLSASNGSTSGSSVTLAATDYVFKDIAGGSNVIESFTPEPVTFSLMGLGLLAIGFAGRKRMRKD
jgi:hypothetical protein